MPASAPLRPLAFAALLLLCASCAPQSPSPPNILFIFSDDHARQAVSAYGSKINRTPHIDRLASEGLLFTNCLVTNSICAPSRATVLTGKYSHANGQITNVESFDGAQMTFPKLLQEIGYETAMIGKWHLKSAPTGFDHWQVLIGQGPYYNPPIRTATDTTIVEGYTSDIITDLALDWLDQRADDSPFLLMYQHKAPHRNWSPGPDHLDDYADLDVPMPESFYDDYQGGRTVAAERSVMRIADNLNGHDLKITPPGNLTDAQLERWNQSYGPRNDAVREADLSGDALVNWKYQRYVKDYLRSVQSLDDNIGRVLDYLDESGLAENTLVIYASDQGWYLGEHGWYDKRWMYEPSLRTPFIARWPGTIAPGSVSDALVSNVDFAPTFLSAAGVAIPEAMHGRSLLPVFEAAESGGQQPNLQAMELIEATRPGAAVPIYETPPDPMATFTTPSGWRGSFYYHYYEFPGWHCVRRHYGVRTDRYKLIHFYTLDDWELFDLQADPDELVNQYHNPDFSDIRSELETELQRLRVELNVPDDVRPDGEAECTVGGVGWEGYADE
ncbi:MAG: sulfatase [Rhodothermales bacterium]|nr:sulfatase [Rhodothermales bacterium]MBO6781133.1 sulfatase [Rhodothermales bacterium]